jgi:hypothetical protein
VEKLRKGRKVKRMGRCILIFNGNRAERKFENEFLIGMSPARKAEDKGMRGRKLFIIVALKSKIIIFDHRAYVSIEQIFQHCILVEKH